MTTWNRRRRRSRMETTRMITLWLACLAVIAVVGLAVQVILHLWLAVLVIAAGLAVAFYAGRRYERRRVRNRASGIRRGQLDGAAAGIDGRDHAADDPGSLRSRLLADRFSGTRPLGGAR